MQKEDGMDWVWIAIWFVLCFCGIIWIAEREWKIVGWALLFLVVIMVGMGLSCFVPLDF